MLWRKGKAAEFSQQAQLIGRVLALWSAPGSVGRSQVAASIAIELAHLGYRTLLVDADVVAPSQLQLFGFAENHIGIAAACRLAARDELTLSADGQSLGLIPPAFCCRRRGNSSTTWWLMPHGRSNES